MSSVGDFVGRKEQPAYVRFERRAVEDKAATKASNDGTVKYKDIDYALVTPPYSRDVHEQKVDVWLGQMKREASNGRLPHEWCDRYEEAYRRWKAGEEMPLDGTPIKGWPVISPAQQKTIIALNILTVESLAAANDEGCRRIGMGAVELKNKANAWLKQAKDKGPLTIENAALKDEVVSLKARNEKLEERVRELAEKVGVMARGGLDSQQHFEQPQQHGISASDILEEPRAEAQPKRRKKQQEAAQEPI